MTAAELAALAGLAGLVGLACAATPPAQTPPDAPAVARIAVERLADHWTLTALHEGPAGPATDYQLRVVRQGAAGRSQSSQGGHFTPAGGAADTLSTVRISAHPGDAIEATLTLTRSGAVVATDTLVEVVADAPR